MARGRSGLVVLAVISFVGGVALYGSTQLSEYGRVTAESSDRAQIVRRFEPVPTWIAVARGGGVVMVVAALVFAGLAIARR